MDEKKGADFPLNFGRGSLEGYRLASWEKQGHHGGFKLLGRWGWPHIQFSCVHTLSPGFSRASQSSWKSSPHRSLPPDQSDEFCFILRQESLQPAADSWWHFQKEMLLFQAELWFAWWIFLGPSLAVICCQLPFPSPGLTLAWANSCPAEFTVTSNFMLSMSIYSFFSRILYDPFFFSSAPQHPGTLLPSSLCTGRVLLLKILMNSLSLNRRDLLLADNLHQVNSGKSGEVLFWCGMLVWQDASGTQMCLLSCPCTLHCPSLHHPLLYCYPNCRWDKI